MTFASLYIEEENPKLLNVDNVKAQGIKAELKQAFSNAGQKIKGLDLKSLSKNITAQGLSDFTQKYAVAGLTKIINGEPITNTTMAEQLFNGFAPMMGMTAVSAGYNSVQQMKNAVTGGNVNVSNFMTGFAGAASAITNANLETANYSKLGSEISVDMIVDISWQYISETPDRRVQSGQTYNEYVHNLPDLIPFSGKIKENGKYTSTEFRELMVGIRDSKKPFIFRAGKDVFENYIFTSFIPSKNFEQSLNFTAEIKKITPGEISVEKVNIPKSGGGSGKKKKVIKKNTKSKTGTSSKSVGNATAPKKLAGVGRVLNVDEGVAKARAKIESWWK